MPQTTHNPSLFARIRRAFTLMEMMVAVAAVAVISVGLAALFSAVGKTVTGGKRVSLLNNYAGLIESRLRRDFAAMDRDGFLVIRQQWVQKVPQDQVGPNATDDNDRIPVSPDDTNPRRRRADEIVFFVKGRFASARQPLHPDVTPESGVARIYYGHGQRKLDDPSTGTTAYLEPELTELNDDIDGRLGAEPAGLTNPNRFAGDWILLRHETLLINPETTTAAPYKALPGWTVGDPRQFDSDRQIGMQPAAASIFRWLNIRPPVPANPALVRTRGDADYPQFASGLVDIATTDLAEIRRIVLGATVRPDQIAPGDLFPNTDPTDGGYNLALTYPETPVAVPSPPSFPPRPMFAQSVDRMHLWMAQAFPTQSAAANPSNNSEYYPAGEAAGARMRCEAQPLNLLETLRDATATDIDAATYRADQLMLSSSNLLPHCSEFIIEWSFGSTDATGQVVWHGPRRRFDTNRNSLPDDFEPEMVLPYPYSMTGSFPAQFRYHRAGDPANTLTAHTFTERLFYGYTPDHETSVLTSYFGYVDPTFPVPDDADNNGQIDNGLPDQIATLPCPWPRMIRVTITISDPQQPTIESTFQFIFTTPENPGVS